MEQFSAVSSNKRIAKNTLMLYIRMFLATIVGLYTTRVVIQTLGVEDYGIYSVVGSVTAMLSFLKSSMSSSTSRFLSYDLGKGNQIKLQETFSSAMIIHILFAVGVILIGETIGLWFLENKLVIPDGRMEAAKWVLHMSVISSAVTFTQVPYDSCIIAHERMKVYAYVEILNVTLKLVVVYLLVIGCVDKLKLYSSLLLLVTIIISIIYRVYCVRNFKETFIIWSLRSSVVKRLMGFSIWQMFSSLCMTLKQQGQSFIVNIYHGVTLNASLGISDMLYGTLTSFSYNMLTAFNPPIIKAYASGNYVEMNKLLSNAAKMSFLLMAFVSIPLIINVRYILELWLEKVPEYVCEISTIALIFNCFGVVNSVVSYSINATGKNRNKSIIIGLSMLMALIVLLLTFMAQLPIIYSFCAFYVGTPIMLIGCLIEAKRKVPFLSIISFCKEGILKPCIIAVAIYTMVALLASVLEKGFFQLLATTSVSTILFFLLTFIFILDASQRAVVSNKINRLINK